MGARALVATIPTSPRLAQRKRNKNTQLPVFPWKRFEAYFTSYCLRFWLLISMHLIAGYSLPKRVGTSLLSSCSLLQQENSVK